MPDGTEVAVKQLSVGSKQGNDEFLNEVMFITSVQHRNLVKLRGCCLKADERILVYEYLPNRSLSQALFGITNLGFKALHCFIYSISKLFVYSISVAIVVKCEIGWEYLTILFVPSQTPMLKS